MSSSKASGERINYKLPTHDVLAPFGDDPCPQFTVRVFAFLEDRIESMQVWAAKGLTQFSYEVAYLSGTGMTTAEIASELDISSSTVLKRRRKALKALEEVLDRPATEVEFLMACNFLQAIPQSGSLCLRVPEAEVINIDELLV